MRSVSIHIVFFCFDIVLVAQLGNTISRPQFLLNHRRLQVVIKLGRQDLYLLVTFIIEFKTVIGLVVSHHLRRCDIHLRIVFAVRVKNSEDLANISYRIIYA